VKKIYKVAKDREPVGLSYHVKITKDYIFIAIEKCYKMPLHKVIGNTSLYRSIQDQILVKL